MRTQLDFWGYLKNNLFLKARNAADSADVNLLKLNGSDKIEFGSVPQVTADPVAANDLVRKSYADSVGAGPLAGKETDTLDATDITNQFWDLPSHVVKANSVHFAVGGGRVLNEGPDFSVSLTGGVGGFSRITFLNDIATGGATPLADGMIIYVKYLY